MRLRREPATTYALDAGELHQALRALVVPLTEAELSHHAKIDQ